MLSQEIELQVNYDRVLQCARDYIRAKTHGNCAVESYYEILKDAVAQFANTEYLDWCHEVDKLFDGLVNASGKTVTDALLLKQLEEWNPQTVYVQGHTTIVAAAMLYALLFGTEKEENGEPCT